MNAVLLTRATLAGLVLSGIGVSSAVLAQVQPSLQTDGKSHQQAQYEAALGYIRTGKVQSCAGDLALLRYPYEDGYRRARDAADSNVQASPADVHRRALRQAIAKLPVRQMRPNGARAASPDEDHAASAREAGRASFNAAIAILEKLVAANPAQATWQRDLAVAYAGLASVSGEWTTGRDLHQKAVDLQKSVVAKDPSNQALQHDLADMYQGLGAVQFGMGGEKPARTAKVAELEIREKLAEEAPSNATFQHELALNYDRLGRMFHIVGNRDQARDAYQAGFETYGQLVKRDPANLQWQRDLASNRFGAADFEISKGKVAVGARMLQEALLLRTASIERDPSNVDAQLDLRDTLRRVADRADDAIAGYRQALAELQRFAAGSPADPGWLYYQLEFQFMIGFLTEDEIRLRLGSREAPPREQVKRINALTNEVFQSILTTSRELVAMSAAPETIRIYEIAQAPRLCKISL